MYEVATTPEEQQKAVELSSEKWIMEIKAAQKNQEKWVTGAQDIVKRYLDRRDLAAESQNRVNLFTTNTNILMATLYARIPKPMVTREFEDQSDDVARVASMIIERCLKVRSGDDFDVAIRYVVQDRLVSGLGTVWARYEPTFKKVMTEPVIDEISQMVMEEAQEVEVVDTEKVCTDYVFWEDILWSPVRVWEDLSWIGRKVKMTKKDAEARFGEKIASYLKFDSTQKAGDASAEHPQSKRKFASIFEIWCKISKKVYWVSEGCPVILDQKDDPLKLKDFWPTPRFMHAMMSTSNFMPRPDYLMAQDQYEELNKVNHRITMLEQAIRVVGIYNGNNAEIERIFTEGVDNKLIPSRSFSEFAEKGGFKGQVDWLPIEPIVMALDKLRQVRQDLIAQIYEVTGISDIMRGSSKASETLGAQQLKAQYSSVKLQHLQMEVAAFVQNALRIKADIIQNQFDPENIKLLANVMSFMPEDQQYVDQAIELIKSGQMEYRIEVHADSMAVPEFNAERDGRMGFMRAIAEMMTAAAPILERDPGAGVAMLKVVQWGAASFRTGREIEGVIDSAIASIEKSLKAPKPEAPPDPKILELQAKQKMHADDQQFEMQKAQAEMASRERIEQMSLASQERMAQAKLDSAQAIASMEAMIKKQTEEMLARVEYVLEQQKMNLDASLEQSKTEVTAQSDAAAESAQAMVKLAKAISAPRKRIPKYNADGDIEAVEEIIEGSSDEGDIDPANIAQVVQTLVQTLSQPRRRVARHDANGIITQVDETIGE